METPDVLPTPQGGAQTPGYFFAQILLGLGFAGLDGTAIGKVTSQFSLSSFLASQFIKDLSVLTEFDGPWCADF